MSLSSNIKQLPLDVNKQKGTDCPGSLLSTENSLSACERELGRYRKLTLDSPNLCSNYIFSVRPRNQHCQPSPGLHHIQHFLIYCRVYYLF